MTFSAKKTSNDQILKDISPRFHSELIEANKRIKQKMSISDILCGINKVSSKCSGSCLLLQPNAAQYCWSNRTIPVVFIVNWDGNIHVQVRRSKSVRGCAVTVAVWPELRGFPNKNSKSKLQQWLSRDAGSVICQQDLPDLPTTDPTCRWTEYTVSSLRWKEWQ